MNQRLRFQVTNKRNPAGKPQQLGRQRWKTPQEARNGCWFTREACSLKMGFITSFACSSWNGRQSSSGRWTSSRKTWWRSRVKRRSGGSKSGNRSQQGAMKTSRCSSGSSTRAWITRRRVWSTCFTSGRCRSSLLKSQGLRKRSLLSRFQGEIQKAESGTQPQTIRMKIERVLRHHLNRLWSLRSHTSDLAQSSIHSTYHSMNKSRTSWSDISRFQRLTRSIAGWNTRGPQSWSGENRSELLSRKLTETRLKAREVQINWIATRANRIAWLQFLDLLLLHFFKTRRKVIISISKDSTKASRRTSTELRQTIRSAISRSPDQITSPTSQRHCRPLRAQRSTSTEAYPSKTSTKSWSRFTTNSTQDWELPASSPKWTKLTRSWTQRPTIPETPTSRLSRISISATPWQTSDPP